MYFQLVSNKLSIKRSLNIFLDSTEKACAKDLRDQNIAVLIRMHELGNWSKRFLLQEITLFGVLKLLNVFFCLLGEKNFKLASN